MVDYTVTTNTDQETVLSSYAAALGTTQADLLQAEAEARMDALLQNVYNSWWNGLTIAEKKTIHSTNSA